MADAALGLRRNTVMTAAAILTVSISLSLLGVALLVRQETLKIQRYVYTNVEVSIFLSEDVSSAQRDDVRATLQALPVVSHVTYEDQAEAFRRFSIQYKDTPSLIENVTPASMPESFRVKLTDPTEFEVVRSALAGHPGIDEVSDQRALLDKLFGVLNGLRNAAVALAVVQLLAAIMLISNTVRVAAHARRQETALMRLVGASRAYIQLPFLLEGLVTGLVGGVIAVVVLGCGKVLLLDRTLAPLFGSGALPALGWSEILAQAPGLLMLGLLVAGVSSLISIRRHVRI
jgi:cell division transport system permease protein